jgi:hypothetical protein
MECGKVIGRVLFLILILIFRRAFRIGAAMAGLRIRLGTNGCTDVGGDPFRVSAIWSRAASINRIGLSTYFAFPAGRVSLQT